MVRQFHQRLSAFISGPFLFASQDHRTDPAMRTCKGSRRWYIGGVRRLVRLSVETVPPHSMSGSAAIVRRGI